GSPLHKSTQQVENLRPDTACGLQAEKTGRFSLHRRDNTRPDKTRPASHQASCSDAGCGVNALSGLQKQYFQQVLLTSASGNLVLSTLMALSFSTL
ncbi:hypothetical protein, partial [Escherichia coli]|uniref:hypothetical protein n=1 Tax=Escherichia coli TaxID=562 RepID=UPI00207BC8E3